MCRMQHANTDPASSYYLLTLPQQLQLQQLSNKKLKTEMSKNRTYNDNTLKKEIAMHAVNVKMGGNCFTSCNQSLTNCLTTEHISCGRLP